MAQEPGSNLQIDDPDTIPGDPSYEQDAETLLQTVAPPKKSLGKRIVEGVKSGVTDIVTHPVQTAKSAGRGVLDAADALAETSISLGASILKKTGLGKLLGGQEWEDAFDALGGAEGMAKAGTEWIDGTNDAIFGKRATTGGQGFVEDIATFATGFAASGALKLVRGGQTLAQIGKAAPLVTGAARGALVDFAAFDPYRESLAELAASTKMAGISQVGDLLSVKEDDGPAVARLKRAMGGVIPGVAIDGIVATSRIVRNLEILKSAKATPEARAAAEAAVAENQKILSDISAGTHSTGEPVQVRPGADGGWDASLEHVHPSWLEQFPNAKNADELNGMIAKWLDDKSGHTARTAENKKALGKFLGRPEMEADAAVINEALAARMRGYADFSDETVRSTFELAKDLEDAAAKGDHDRLASLISDAHMRFNFSYMDTPAKSEAMLKAIGETLSETFDKAQGRPGVPLSESVDRALKLAGMLTKDQAKGYFENASNVIKNSDAILLAMNARMVSLAEDVGKWSRILDNNPMSAGALAESRAALRAWAEEAVRVSGSNSGQGRGLKALVARGDPALKDMKFKGEPGAVDTPGSIPTKPIEQDAIDQMTAADIRKTVRLFRITNKPQHLFDLGRAVVVDNAVDKTGKPLGRMARFGNGLGEFFYNSILSAPSTWAGIWGSTGAVSLYEDAVRGLAGVATANPTLIREAASILQGRVIYGKQSVIGFASALKAGHSIIDAKPVYKMIPTAAGEVIRSMGTRPIAAMDEFWRVNNYLSWVRAKATTAAREEAAAKGLTGRSYDLAVKDIVDATVEASRTEIGAGRVPEAREFASLPTMSQALKSGGIGESIEDLVRKHPILAPIAPFVRPSVNVVDYAFLKNSPLGLLSSQMRETLAKGGPEAAILGTRMAVGSTLWGTAAAMAFGGQITGSGPADPELKKLWLQNHQPYSIRMGDEWVSYRRIEPFATMLSGTADLAQIVRDNSDDLEIQQDAQKTMLAFMAAASSAMTNKTYLSGTVRFFEAFGSNSPSALKRFWDGLVSVGSPNVLNAFNSDPYLRQSVGMLDALKAKVPGWSQTLPARYNGFGEPITLAPGRIQRALNPFPVKSGKPSLAEDEMVALGKAISTPPTIEKFGKYSVNLNNRVYQNAKGGTLTPYERWMQLIRDTGLRSQVETLMQSDKFQNAGDGTDVAPGGRRFILLRDLVERVYEKTRRQMVSEYPQLKEELKGLSRAARIGKRSDERATNILEQIGK